ncbi:hypothetical protein T439DRAFT_308703 [Meredithblackwellia eburnea MCA 4105]
MSPLSERAPLLPPGMSIPATTVSPACSRFNEANLASLPVYTTIWQVCREIEHYVDVPLSEEQLRSPEIQFAIVLPLEQYFGEMQDPSIVYCLLLNRLHFLRERDSALASSSLNETRAQLCETLAIKLLRHQATEAKGGNPGLLAMSRALVGGFHAFQGASDEVLDRIKQKEGFASRILSDGAGKTNALELAILGKARTFIKSQPTQRVITAVWEGKIVYSSSSFLDILPDRWKVHDIRLYNLKSAPILDHYRLRVPKYRSYIELFSFLVLFTSFIAVIAERRNRHEHLPVSDLTGYEYWFFFYSLGYSLDKLASIAEHGWSVYAAGLTNGLDAMCIPIFAVSFGFRVHSVTSGDTWSADQAYGILSCAATLMFPRLAFAAVSNNLLILSLRAMLADFFWLMGIAVFCFLGFVFALSHLSEGDYSVSRIAEWLVFIWFGLDGTGIDTSIKFHPLLGPILFVSYAALSNTLLVSLLVAILSGTYSSIAADAAAEDMFRKAVMTFEGVKADSLFDYVPPLNIVALCLMWPISKVTSPRWFHKINVATTRVFSLPILLSIAFYERHTLAGSPAREWLAEISARTTAALPTKWAQKLSLLEGAHWECEAVFEYSPSGDESDSDESDGMGVTDDVEDAIENATLRPSNRISSRASAIIAAAPPSKSSKSPPPPFSASPTSDQFDATTMGTPAVTASPTPISPSKKKETQSVTFPSSVGQGLARSQTMHHGHSSHSSHHHHREGHHGHERLPSNASGYGAFGGFKRSASPTRSDSGLSTSAPTARYTSPLAELYSHRERRPSMLPPSDPTVIPAGQAELRQMVQSLASALARLEERLDGRGPEEAIE